MDNENQHLTIVNRHWTKQKLNIKKTLDNGKATEDNKKIGYWKAYI